MRVPDHVRARHPLDPALHRRLVTIEELRRVVAAPARLRMILVLGGLPRPLVQVGLPRPGGALVARPDLLYPEAWLAIEYDGATHRDTLVAGNRRQNRLLAAGYSVLRHTGADVFGRPDAMLEEVRGQLGRRPA